VTPTALPRKNNKVAIKRDAISTKKSHIRTSTRKIGGEANPKKRSSGVTHPHAGRGPAADRNMVLPRDAGKATPLSEKTSRFQG